MSLELEARAYTNNLPETLSLLKQEISSCLALKKKTTETT